MSRDHILKEIQRTTQENGGTPLGMQRFANETGIKRSAWYGKYWACYGDALKEAGLSPNKLQGAIDPDVLLKRYAELARELGHLPTSGEIRLKGRTDKTFPSDGTFVLRFKSKLNLAKMLLEYCNKNARSDVASLCADYISKNPDVTEEPSQNKQQAGYVYLLKSGRHYKIGKTFNPIRREGEIATQLPEKIEPLHYIETDDPSGIEAYWHRRFADKRKEGEWFALTSDDIRAFKRWRSIF